ncbi:MAG: radical SAM protein [Candidatus Omnitrophica bacterium]|nr:radical SAM protein [Candidatus Omnitrophota bacterium]
MLKVLTLNLSKYFPFLLKTIAYVPDSITISLTYNCNCRCIMCNYWKYAKPDDMNAETVKDIMFQAKQAGVKACVLYGGEPLLRKDIFDLTAYAHDLGLVTKIITNGMLLDREKAEKLVDSGLDKIVISIDTVDNNQDYIRGVKDAFLKAREGLSNMVRLRDKKNIEIMIASVLMRPTLKEQRILKVVDMAREMKVSVLIQLVDFSLFYYKGVDEQLKKELWITDENQEELKELVKKLIEIKKESPELIVDSIPALQYIPRYFKDPKSADIPCYIGFSGRIWISPQAEVFICQGLSAIGDLKKQSFKEILQSKALRQMLEKMFRKNCSGCSCMFSSNIDAHIPCMWKDYMARNLGLRK